MRVLFATNHGYLPYRAGGSESSTHELCLAVARRGVSCAVLAGFEGAGIWPMAMRIMRRLGQQSRYPADPTMGYPVFRGWVPSEGIEDVIRRFEPDVACVQAGRPLELASRLIAHKVPTVVYLRDTDFDKLGGDVTGIPEISYIANSNFTARRFAETFGISARVLPPPIPRDRYVTPTTRERVLFVNPVPSKGVELAFRLAEMRPDIPFDFLEGWPLDSQTRTALQERALRCGNIRWRDRISDMRAAYRDAKLVLVPSQWEEAWGRVVAEAQVSGIPALASRCGGLAESVGSGGILLEPLAPIAEWAEALEKIWDDEPTYQRYSAEALAISIRRQTGFDGQIDDFISILSACVAGFEPTAKLGYARAS